MPRFRSRARFRLLRRRFHEADHLVLVVLAAVVGLLAGFGSLAVRFLISVVTGLSFGAGDGLLLGGTSVPWWRLLLMPALGGLLVGPVIWYLARETRGSGVPEVMAAVLLRQGRIRPRVAAVKTLVSPITIGSGGSAGREGPMAQIGATLGSMVGVLSRLPPRGVKTLVAAGAAGGIAAAFNAPIGGSLFALEIVLGDFAVSAFSPVVISAVAATVVSRAFEGDFTAFHVPIYELRSAWEFVPYGLLGIGAGLVAVVFVMLLYQQERFWERLPFPEPMKPALGGLLVGALGVFAPPILGSGYAGITGAMLGRFDWWLLLLFIPLKLLSTSFTLGSGGSGGIFAPSLFLGAALGGAVGQAAAAWAPHPVGTPGGYALVGMGALVAATTQAPITAILILFELTGNYRIILPLMTACILSTLLASLLKRQSIYTQKLEWMGIQLREGREEGILKRLPVGRVVTDRFASFRRDTNLEEMVSAALGETQETFPVLDGEGKLRGIVRFGDLKALVREESLSGLVRAVDVALPPVSLTPGDSLRRALQEFHEHRVDALPVVEGGRVTGVVFERDVLSLYDNELHKLDLANEVTSRRRFSARDEGLDMGGGFRLDDIPVPTDLLGETLRSAELRQEYGIEVLFLRRGRTEEQELATPDHVLETGDRLVVLGPREALRRFRSPRRTPGEGDGAGRR